MRQEQNEITVEKNLPLCIVPQDAHSVPLPRKRRLSTVPTDYLIMQGSLQSLISANKELIYIYL